MSQINQEMPVFDVSSIPNEFNPLSSFDNTADAKLYAGDDKLFVQFKTEAVINPHASTKAGRAIYDDIDMIVIRTPGSQLCSIVAPAKHYMNRFGDRYNRWKAGQKELESGTPLENFPVLFTKPSMIAELKAMNVYTVEQLASLSDAGKQKIMGGFELCKRAAAWIEHSKGAAADEEKEELKAKLATMEAQLKFLTNNAPPQKASSKG